MYLLLFILVCALCLCRDVQGWGPPITSELTLDYATLIGVSNEMTNIISFRGVPFADPPLGDLRWREARLPTQWLGEVNATVYGNACITGRQTGPTEGYSEDCLVGNIYVPIGTHTLSNLPVYVFFHGGGFQGGSTRTLPPEYIMTSSKKPFIFATFEYRLAQFGFLAGSAVNASGVANAGLLDQRTALRWVQQYIGQFGGDKDQVTIGGQSAGAAMNMLHLIANGGDNEGLFKAAMGDSPALNALPHYADPAVEGLFSQYSTFAGCGNATDVMACLRAANVSDLTLAGNQTLEARPSTLFPWSPILDQNYLTERAVDAFEKGHFAKVPVLFGSNTDEGAGWASGVRNPNANTSMANTTDVTLYNFFQGQWGSLPSDAFNAVRLIYPESQFSNISSQGELMYGNARYICTASMIAGAASEISPAYQFHYDNPINGSTHGDELFAFFNPPPSDPSAQMLFEAMRQYWTSFVTDGKPCATGFPEWQKVRTDADADGSPRILLNPSGIAMENVTFELSARCAVWHALNRAMNT